MIETNGICRKQTQTLSIPYVNPQNPSTHQISCTAELSAAESRYERLLSAVERGGGSEKREVEAQAKELMAELNIQRQGYDPLSSLSSLLSLLSPFCFILSLSSFFLPPSSSLLPPSRDS
jgi:hypothetical protein